MKTNTFKSLNPKGKTPLILICDHACNHIPASLVNLGLEEEQLSKHIGWDIGAALITQEISHILDATAILCGTSRLVIDANRSPNDDECIPEFSDNFCIPGNQDLTMSHRKDRIKKYFWPSHDAISDAIDTFRRDSQYPRNIPIIFSIHTFTPKLESQKKLTRPWDIGVLWNRDPRVANPLIHLLQNHSRNFIVGDNKPYSGKEFYHSLDFHAGSAGLPHCAIEIRQDLVSTTTDIARWANIISKQIMKIADVPNIHNIVHY